MSFKTVQRALVSAVVVAALSAGPAAAANIVDEMLPDYRKITDETRESINSIGAQINNGHHVLQQADIFLRQVDSTGAVLAERDRKCADLEEEMKNVPPEAQWRFTTALQHCRGGLEPMIRRFRYMVEKIGEIKRKVDEIKRTVSGLEVSLEAESRNLAASNGMTDLERSLAGYNDDLKNSRY